MKELLQRLSDRFSLKEITYQRDNLIFITVEKSNVIPFITHLKQHENFSHLVMIGAVDYIENGTFQLTYLLHNYSLHADIGVRVHVQRENPVMESIHTIWAQARTYQREIREMFGIDFPGSPDVDKPFLLEGWQNIPPMRKDFDTLKYSQETYFPRSGRKHYDPQNYMKQKLYPDKEPE
ncbi:MAG: NADH-quinone oxidoreductase subunit C [Candidatus Cloacimonetes bacterium]|nr:NADH-quinone oxidoreductase subunit C [Candidatus Cloacimonadota bacterium]